MRRPIAILTVLAALALGLAACGSGGEESTSNSSSSSSSAAAPATDTSTTPAQTQTGDAGAATESSTTATDTSTTATADNKDLSQKPTITAGQGAPPDHLVVKDIVKGDGPVAHKHDTVTIQYVGALYDNGKQFDSSWDRGQPATFPLDQLIPGWQKGIPGMHVGGRRELIIPPDLGYGPQGTPDGSIPPNATLIFIIDLLHVGGGATG